MALSGGEGRLEPDGPAGGEAYPEPDNPAGGAADGGVFAASPLRLAAFVERLRDEKLPVQVYERPRVAFFQPECVLAYEVA